MAQKKSADDPDLGFANALKSVDGRAMLAEWLRELHFMQGPVKGDDAYNAQIVGVKMVKRMFGIDPGMTMELLSDHFFEERD